MSPRILIMLAIISAISIGSGAIVFGALEILSSAQEAVSTIIAVGATLVTGGLAALVAQIAGAFRDLGEDQ